eukprot:COSAG01_NODE_24240_length_785_cov_4.313411_1_plen_148_part_00
MPGSGTVWAGDASAAAASCQHRMGSGNGPVRWPIGGGGERSRPSMVLRRTLTQADRPPAPAEQFAFAQPHGPRKVFRILICDFLLTGASPMLLKRQFFFQIRTALFRNPQIISAWSVNTKATCPGARACLTANSGHQDRTELDSGID